MAGDWFKGVAVVLFCVTVATTAWGDGLYPARTGRVVDQAGLLSQSARDRITQQLAEHERSTSNQVVVVTVKSLGGMRIETFTLNLANVWGVGQRGRDNGVVLLVAPNEREVRIEVGTGLEPRLTDRIAADIIEQRMLPAFRAGLHQAGIQEGVDGILSAIADTYQMVERPRQQSSRRRDRSDGPGTVIIILVLVIVIIVLLFKRAGRAGYPEYDYADRRRRSWRYDDDDDNGWRRSSSSSTSFGGGSSSSRSSGSGSSGSRSSGGGSFRGGGASGRW